MKVELKQPEIIDALKGYLTSQGINVTGKSVQVTFTAGRKESGLSAEINITEHTGIVASVKRQTETQIGTFNDVSKLPADDTPAQPEEAVVTPTATPASLFA